MDTKNADSILKCDTMAEIRQNHVVVGAKQFKKALRDNRAIKAYLAQNADPAITEPLELLCRQQNIHITWVSSMSELGQHCGIEVGAAAAAVVDP